MSKQRQNPHFPAREISTRQRPTISAPEHRVAKRETCSAEASLFCRLFVEVPHSRVGPATARKIFSPFAQSLADLAVLFQCTRRHKKSSERERKTQKRGRGRLRGFSRCPETKRRDKALLHGQKRARSRFHAFSLSLSPKTHKNAPPICSATVSGFVLRAVADANIRKTRESGSA